MSSPRDWILRARDRRRGRGISFLVPFSPGIAEDRDRIWDWLHRYWAFNLPGVEIVMGSDPSHHLAEPGLPFSKSAAVNAAAGLATGDVFVIIDADAYLAPELVRFAVEEIREARKTGRRLWYVPYRHFWRTSLDATERILTSDPRNPWHLPDPPAKADIDEGSEISEKFGHHFGAMITIVPRLAFEEVGGMDPRFCVDEETEILTRDGWKTHETVGVGDLALTLNHETGMSEWQPVQAVNRFEGSHEMLSIESKTHSSLTTLNHRWPVINRKQPYTRTSDRVGYGMTVPVRGWATSANHTTNQRVPIAAECADLPTAAIHSDAFVQLVAWFWTEGSIRPKPDASGEFYRPAQITQSIDANADKCDLILAACRSVFGEPSDMFPRRGLSKDPHRPQWRPTYNRWNLEVVFNAEAGDLLQRAAPGRVPTPSFLLSLTRAQLELFIETSMLGDGHTRAGHYERALAQKDPVAIDAFQLACTLAGHPTSVVTSPVMEKYGYGMTTLRIRSQRSFKLSKGKHERQILKGVVWCPTTPNGTWLARRRGKTYFTANSGWGAEDVSWVRAVDTIYSVHKTINRSVYHMHHGTIGVGINRQWQGQTRKKPFTILGPRYLAAYGDRARMLRLIAEWKDDDGGKTDAVATTPSLRNP